MAKTLEIIEKHGALDNLYDMLLENYPAAIIDNVIKLKDDVHGIFVNYSQSILTYPHRMILKGPEDQMLIKIANFSKKKSIVNYMIIDDVAYIEYLNKGENDNPTMKWLTKRSHDD